MRLGPLVLFEKGVAVGIADKNGNGIGLVYDRIEASGYEFERGSTPPVRCKIRGKMYVVGNAPDYWPGEDR